MNLAEQRRYGRAYLRWFRLLQRRAFRLALRWLTLARDGVLSSLEQFGIERTLSNVDGLVRTAGIQDLFQRMYQNVLPEAAQREFDRLRELTVVPAEVTTAGFFSQVWLNTTVRILSDAETAVRITKIAETLRGQIRRILLQATVERLDVRQTARRIRVALGGKGARTRSLLIARTETTRAANAGHEAGALSTSLKLNKVWIATVDTRTRTGHRAMLGKKPIPRDDLFVVNGAKMKYPGDPAGGVANCVNCFLPDELTYVNKDIIKKAFRAWYKGDIVTIKTTAERGFTCTPNHPILTTDGWVKAGQLTNTHKLIKSSVIKRMLLRDFDVNDNPSTFKELYDTLSKELVSVRIGGVDVNFYGDVPTGNVDIVDVESKLRNGRKPILGKVINQLLFKRTDLTQTTLLCNRLFSRSLLKKLPWKRSNFSVSLADNFSFLFQRSPFKTQQIGLATIPFYDIVALQNTADNIAADVVDLSQSEFAFPVNVRRHYLTFWKGKLRLFSKILARVNSILFKNFPNGHHTNADVVSDLLNRTSAVIATDDVVSIEITPNYSGHVYTFETYTNIYDINSYIAKNCRCTVAYVPSKNHSST